MGNHDSYSDRRWQRVSSFRSQFRAIQVIDWCPNDGRLMQIIKEYTAAAGTKAFIKNILDQCTQILLNRGALLTPW